MNLINRQLVLATLRALLRGTLWTFATGFFGTLQLLIVVYLGLLFGLVEIDFAKILEEGVLLFFAVSISSSVLVDYYLSKRQDRLLMAGAFTVTAFFLVLMASVTYAGLLNPSVDENIGLLAFTEIVLLIVAGIYALIMKSILMYEPKGAD